MANYFKIEGNEKKTEWSVQTVEYTNNHQLNLVKT